MTKIRSYALLALVCYASISSASASAWAAPTQKSQAIRLKSVVLSRKYDGDAVGVTTTFKPTDLKIHCVAKLNRISSVIARGVWIAVDAGGVKNYEIVEVSQHRIDIYINGKLLGSKAYTIAK